MNKKITFLLLLFVIFFVSGCGGSSLNSISILSVDRIFVDETVTLKLTGEPAKVKIDNIKWKSNDENILKVDENGIITGVNPGKTTITATVGDLSSSKDITVIGHTDSIVIDETELKLALNEEQSIKVTVNPAEIIYTFESDNQSVATVSSDGNIKAVNYGKTKIRVKTEDSVEAICDVTVSIVVPDFSSLSSTEAKKWGTDNSVSVSIRTDYSDSISSGKMISQSIKAGTEFYEKNDQIEVVYSAGHKATLGESNALKSANNYLSIMAFSAKGLKKQLEYEGYSSSEAQYAVDNCGADWKEQAAKSAQNYIDLMSFSRSGLKKQLKYEGFTEEQAEYGVKAVGY